MSLEVLFRVCKATGPNVHKIAFIDRKKIQQFVRASQTTLRVVGILYTTSVKDADALISRLPAVTAYPDLILAIMPTST